ncbi:HET-domain-containing protein [Byssothecium circinans]|uniref:HET-domain-containing protein n=1 Tax=Byssothecium circinans TaxID=147558 RepID=A0A6A5TIG6_9PLEO|nr:HET-domain-containing protein [Byssothecium circinans]
MRLLHTRTLTFTEFRVSRVPDYAILSHRWLEYEVSYSDMFNLTDEIKQTNGYKKIVHCCKQAASVGLDYVWIDTCCVNKQDKDEVAYAINAMFAWYRKSQVCYCYMYDVPKNDLDLEHKDSKFRTSQWFTRGWTLQELLAPLYLIFFNHDWEEIGTKSSFKGIIAEITGIAPSIVVLNQGGDVSVAQRLAWAAERQTQVAADKSYCLTDLGTINSIGSVEEDEEKAFFRLQVQMLKTSDDQSLFCWQEPPGENRPSAGLLARRASAVMRPSD